MPRPPAPPALPGVPGPRPVDVWRLVWWTERGFLHGMRHGTAGGRALSAVLAILWWPALPILLPVQAALTDRGIDQKLVAAGQFEPRGQSGCCG